MNSYSGSDYDIWILSVDGAQAPIQLTNHPGKDMSPTWDPAGGRRIVFVSDRDGSEDLFLADLDHPQDRFTNLTRSGATDETDPAFSPDGTRIAFAVNLGGVDLIKSLDLGQVDRPAVEIGQGRAPAWSPDGSMIVAELVSPQESRLIGYGLDGTGISPVSVRQPGAGLRATWTEGGFASFTSPVATSGTDGVRLPDTGTPEKAAGRLSLVDLRGVRAPNADPRRATPTRPSRRSGKLWRSGLGGISWGGLTTPLSVSTIPSRRAMPTMIGSTRGALLRWPRMSQMPAGWWSCARTWAAKLIGGCTCGRTTRMAQRVNRCGAIRGISLLDSTAIRTITIAAAPR